jgi:anti-anti-sigma regulatory factor
MLALQALRILGRQQDFDDLGIEYCVTYEVSPPSWEPIDATVRVVSPREPEPAESLLAADLLALVPATGPSKPGDAPDESARASLPERAGSGASATNGAFVLQGELQALRSFASGRGDVVVDCRSLRRMEFVAAGDLLNEVATLRSAGRQVLFVEPNYLVYALMLVMGIHDLAEIRRRKV